MIPILRRLVHEPPQSVPLELRVSWHGHVMVLTSAVLARLRADVLAHHRYNHGREAAERALLGALWRLRPAEEEDREEFDEQVSGTAPFRCSATRGGCRSAVEALRRLADPALLRRLSGSILSPAESMLISGSYQPANGDTLDWTAADGALLDELANLLGPVPEAEDREVRSSSRRRRRRS